MSDHDGKAALDRYPPLIEGYQPRPAAIAAKLGLPSRATAPAEKIPAPPRGGSSIRRPRPVN